MKSVGQYWMEINSLRLVSAILAEQDEEWMSSKIYLNMKP
jgi:hypothetical protein